MKHYTAIVPCQHLMITLMVIFTPLISYAQDYSYPNYKYIDLLSPNAQAFKSYETNDVNLFTGSLNLSIPIYSIEEKNLFHDISLFYSGSGIKVGQNASSVGLGWTLVAGGVISRQILGMPDDKVPSSGFSFYKNEGFSNYYLEPSTLRANKEVVDLTSFATNQKDGEPDMFSFNFGGYSGKFYINSNNRPVLLDNGLNISVKLITKSNLAVGVNDYFQGFIVTTPEGVEYHFGNTQELDNVAPIDKINTVSESVMSEVPKIISSWYLRKIKSKNDGKEMIFTYEKESYSYYTFSAGPYGDLSLVKVRVDGVRLANISTITKNIEFVYDEIRDDLSSYGPLLEETGMNTEAKALNSIIISSNKDDFARKFMLDYDYFISSEIGVSSRLRATGINSDKKRLKLKSISEQVLNNDQIKGNVHLFEYEESIKLPRMLSFAQDHWGYYNGATDNNNTSFKPSLSLNNGSSFGGGANRESSWPHSNAWNLISYTNPLDGKSEFEYEANKVDVFSANINVTENIDIDQLCTSSIDTEVIYSRYTGAATSNAEYGPVLNISLNTPTRFRYNYRALGTTGSGRILLNNQNIKGISSQNENCGSFLLQAGEHTFQVYANSDAYTGGHGVFVELEQEQAAPANENNVCTTSFTGETLYSQYVGAGTSNAEYGTVVNISLEEPAIFQYKFRALGSTGSGKIFLDNKVIELISSETEACNAFVLGRGEYKFQVYANSDAYTGGHGVFVELKKDAITPTEKLVGGSRIENIDYRDENDVVKNTLSFNYQNGILYDIPSYVSLIHNEFFATGRYNNFFSPYMHNDASTLRYISSATDINGNFSFNNKFHVGYLNAEKIFDNGAKELYSYYQGNINYPNDWTYLQDVSCRLIDNRSANAPSDYKDFPAKPEQIDLLYGKLKSLQKRNVSNELVSSETNQYVQHYDVIGDFGFAVGAASNTSTIIGTHYEINSAEIIKTTKEVKEFFPGGTSLSTLLVSDYSGIKSFNNNLVKSSFKSHNEEKVVNNLFIDDFFDCEYDLRTIENNYLVGLQAIEDEYNQRKVDCSTFTCAELTSCDFSAAQQNANKGLRLYCAWTDYLLKSNNLRKNYLYQLENLYENYRSCINRFKTSTNPNDELRSLTYLSLLYNKVNTIVEKVEEYISSSNDKSLTKTYFKYGFENGISSPYLQKIYSTDSRSDQESFASLSGTNIYKDILYNSEPEVTFKNDNGNLVKVISKDGISISYLWNDALSVPIAEVINAELEEIAYTSFEGGGRGFLLEGEDSPDSNDSRTGLKSIMGNNNQLGSWDLPAGEYTFSYWMKNGQSSLMNSNALLQKVEVISETVGETIQGWTYYEKKVRATATNNDLVLKFSGLLDEVRLHPSDAQMTTYTYRPLVGITSETGPNGLTTFYEYDALHRLEFIKNHHKEVIKQYDYKYATSTN